MLQAKRLIVIDSAETAAAAGRPMIGAGYGLVLCEDDMTGTRATLTCGLDYALLIAEAVEAGVADGIDFPVEKFPLRSEGWPAGI